MGPEDKAPLIEHLIELRERLLKAVLAILVGFLACYAFSEEIFAFLAAPLQLAAGGQAKMIVTGLPEAFFTYMKVAFFAGLYLTLPYVLGQIWLFIAPGLYQEEKKALLPFLITTPLLFYSGGAFAYYFVFPLAFAFFLGVPNPEIAPLLTLREYLGLVIQFMFAFGFAFELPILLLLLIKAGIVSTTGLVEKRKYAIVAVFVVAAILTPPDVISQCLLAFPLLAMYEISIIGGRIIEKQRAGKEAAKE